MTAAGLAPKKKVAVKNTATASLFLNVLGFFP